MTPKQQISKIDREVTLIQKQLRKLEKIDVMSAESWQAAWDKHPDLHEAEAALYRRRGQLQVVVGEAQARADAKLTFAAKRKETKAATKHSSVFQYLWECKRAAEMLGFAELSQYYGLGLNAIKL